MRVSSILQSVLFERKSSTGSQDEVFENVKVEDLGFRYRVSLMNFDIEVIFDI